MASIYARRSAFVLADLFDDGRGRGRGRMAMAFDVLAIGGGLLCSP